MKKICENCNKEYETTYEKSKFCSRKCRASKNRNKNIRNNNQILLKWSKKIKAFNMLGSKCEYCGDSNIYHLTFHHKNKNEKESTLADIWNKGWSLIEPEIKKCILLCDNCHRELHYNENEYENRRKTKELIVNYKGNKCQICGYDKCLASLTFHHSKEEEKNYEIAKISLIIENIQELNDEILNELEKCELLCSNCHREKHIDIEKINIEKINKKIENYKESNRIDKEEVYRLYFDQNKKIIEISKILNCSRSNLSELLKEEKIRREVYPSGYTGTVC